MEALFVVVISAAVSIAVAYMTARAATYSKDVISERQKWRERIRGMSVEAAQLIREKRTGDRKFQEILSEFRLSLNPDDPEDIAIIKSLKKSSIQPSLLEADKFLAHVARLLKHDWERAKAESRLFGPGSPNGRDIRRLRSSDYLD